MSELGGESACMANLFDGSEELAAVVERLGEWVPRLLDEPERAASIVGACREALGAGPMSLADGVTRLERAAWRFSRHLLLFLEPDGELVPDVEELGWPPPDFRAIRRRGGGVRSVTRSDGGVVSIEIDSLEPIDVAEPQIDAAIALARGATGLVLDLRRNGGGDPGTVARLAGFVLGPDAVPLSAVHGRGGDVTTWISDPPPRDLCVPADVPVAVLVSDRTFSSAEALAYHLQVRGRVRVFGETTPGAADHVTPFVLTPHVHAQLPIARVEDLATRSSWEGVGVVPDVVVPADDAHLAALALLRR